MEAIEPGAQRTGAVLAAAREAAGIDLVDLARESRVPLRHLTAIEADSHASLPALPYTVGFVKTFARAVGLDPEALALQFRAAATAVFPPVGDAGDDAGGLDGGDLPEQGEGLRRGPCLDLKNALGVE